MWVIKNRVTGEYDSKGISEVRNKVVRAAWGTIGHAKSHITNCHCHYNRFDKWYMDADFIEITENGVGRVEPVIDYLRGYYINRRCSEEILKTLWPNG